MNQIIKKWVDIPKRGKDPKTQVYTEYHKEKSGKRETILFLPGGPGFDHQKYKHDHLFLADDYDLLFWDPRGCGKSSEIDFLTYDMDTFIEDAISICNTYQLEQVIIVGVSFGAMAGQKLALKHSDKIKQLILVVGACSYQFLEKALKNLERKGNKEQHRIATSLFNGELNKADYESFLKVLAPLYSYRKAQGEEIKPIPFEANYDVTNHAFKTYLKEFDVRESLSKIKCKTAVLGGEEDWICDISESHFMAKEIPDSKLYVFKNASHMLSVDVEDQYKESILEFLRG